MSMPFRCRWSRWLAGTALFALWPAMASAQGTDAAPAAPAAPAIDTGDTAWVLTSTALVLLMTIPGLALFYGGLVRAKNVLSTLMHSFFCAAVVSVVWVAVGYSVAFGPTQGGWWGGTSLALLESLLPSGGGAGGSGGAGPHALAPTVPHLLFCAYQMTFAIITPALISGAFAERMRFPAFALLMGLWSLLIYAPLAHWVWGGGWIGTMVGALDFAGGTVVHISSGISALVCALYLGRRHGYGVEPMPPHNLPFTVIGAGLLWVGWFGFNAGSALGSNGLAALALVNTNTAAAAAALAWMAMELARSRKATLLGAASGAVAGLVVVTPAAGFVTPAAALAMGAVGGAVCYFAVSFKSKFGYDDALDVVGVHFVGGTLGAILTGVFATSRANPAIEALTGGGDGGALFGPMPGGLVEGHGGLIVKQVVAVVATILFAGLGTWALLVVVNLVTRVRAEAEDEVLGMDLSQHRERGYVIGGGEAVAAAAAVMAEPRQSSAPPPPPRKRFDVVVEGLTADAVAARWRAVCGGESASGADGASPGRGMPAGFLTIRGNRLRFLDGDPEGTRSRVEALLGGGARARVEHP